MAAAIGNDYAKKAKVFADAIRKQFVQQPERLQRIIDKQIELAEQGEIQSAIYVRDTLDGKPHQSSDVSISGNLQDALASIQAIPVPGDTDAT